MYIQCFGKKGFYPRSEFGDDFVCVRHCRKNFKSNGCERKDDSIHV
ncbi:hypothetical protein QMN02_15835 [Leptospira santarosai]|nr:hypothetical protein [Leptospira santarosai]MDI7166524.1 hypothetical protein [Leptospira santarosai]